MIRGRQALFWSLAFPLMFTVIFGFFFGSGNTKAGTIAVVNKSNSELASAYQTALQNADLFTVKTDVPESEIRGDMQKSTVAAGVIIPENFGAKVPGAPTTVTIIDDPANNQTNSILFNFTNQFFTQADYQIHNIKPTFSVVEDKTNQRTLSYFDFVLMGLIGLALMNASVQGIAITMANYREDKILKRITTTPLATWKFIAAEVVARLVVNVVQISLILGVGVWAFDAHIYGNIFLLYLFGLIGGLLFQSIGFMVAAIAKTTDAAQGMAISITIPMMFLAGVFFPIDSLPRWLLAIVQYLPLAPLLRMVRAIGLEGTSPFVNPLNIEIVAGWIIVTLLVSLWRFRLSDE